MNLPDTVAFYEAKGVDAAIAEYEERARKLSAANKAHTNACIAQREAEEAAQEAKEAADFMGRVVLAILSRRGKAA